MSTAKSTPKDAQVMSAILKDMGIIEHEPRVINQMLEFTYRYVTTILDDARLFSSHCKKKSLDTDDVRLAVQLQMDKSFTTPPPRDLLLEIARQKNNIPLPLIKANAGPRLPPDRYSLTACNYRLKPSKKPRTQVRGSGGHNLNISSSPSVPKLSAAVNLNSKTGSTLSVITKNMTSPTVTIVSRPASMPGITKTVPTPLIKLSQGGPAVVSMASSISSSSSVTTPSSAAQASTNVSSSMPTDLKAPGTPMDTSTGVKTGVKREREDDPDDYDAN